jgi:ankyrin repeat protein
MGDKDLLSDEGLFDALILKKETLINRWKETAFINNPTDDKVIFTLNTKFGNNRTLRDEFLDNIIKYRQLSSQSTSMLDQELIDLKNEIDKQLEYKVDKYSKPLNKTQGTYTGYANSTKITEKQVNNYFNRFKPNAYESASDTYTQLMSAIDSGDLSKVNGLLEKLTPEEINQSDRYGKTPLITAVENATKTRKSLNKYQKDFAKEQNIWDLPASKNSGNQTEGDSLDVSTNNLENMQEIVTALIEKGADINAPISANSYDDSCDTPLLIAVKNNNLSMVELLLSRSQSELEKQEMLKFRDKDGNTPLILAIKKNQSNELITSYGIAEALINAGAVNYPDEAGYTPLDWAQACGRGAIMKLLQKKEAIHNRKGLGLPNLDDQSYRSNEVREKSKRGRPPNYR